MGSINDDIREYKTQLGKGFIQRAYKGIITFMSDLKTYLESRHSDFSASALYFGYMDMTYFAFTSAGLKDMKLKLAVVFLHEECRFEIWLAGSNRQVQADYIELFKKKNIGGYTLSKVSPGVDSIIVSAIDEQPDFDRPDELKKKIEDKITAFEKDIRVMLN
jgi:hypothetical protein